MNALFYSILFTIVIDQCHDYKKVVIFRSSLLRAPPLLNLINVHGTVQNDNRFCYEKKFSRDINVLIKRQRVLFLIF